MRQIVLDTETTGLEAAKGHRIIEIGCVELVNRKLTGRVYHQYIQPDRKVDQGAYEVHGISNEFLENKPRFIEILDDFISFVRDSELIIHNAPFDVGFLNNEFRLNKAKLSVEKLCTVLDTLVLARKLHPGQKNNLDVLCKRYGIDNSKRDKHGALLDAEILSDVYLAMTGGQVDLLFAEDVKKTNAQSRQSLNKAWLDSVANIPIIEASLDEVEAHQSRLMEIDEASQSNCLWTTKRYD